MELEAHLKDHDQQIQAIFEAIHQLMAAPEKPKKIYPVISESYLAGEIGCTVKEKQKAYGKKRKRKRTVKKSQKRYQGGRIHDRTPETRTAEAETSYCG